MSEETDTLRPLRVARKTTEAHQMVTFELIDPTGAELPPFSAGSHIDVTIPGPKGELVRQYSLVNSEKERHRYLIGVWKDANSRGGSKALHEVVAEGDFLKISPPRSLPSPTAPRKASRSRSLPTACRPSAWASASWQPADGRFSMPSRGSRVAAAGA